LHALTHGTIVSKPKAIHWAREKLETPWKQLIDKAAAVSHHDEIDISLNETLDFIRFIRDQNLKNEINHP
jgi:hypothetical protein